MFAARQSVRLAGLRARLASTLAFVESEQGIVSKASLSALNAASKITNPITAVFVGSDASTAAESLKKSYSCDQLKDIIVVKDSELDHYLPERVTPVIVDMLKQPEYSHFITASSSVGKNILARIGALLDNQPVSEVVEIKDSQTFVRPIYAGNILSTVKNTQEKNILSVRASSFASIPEGSTESATISEQTAPVSEDIAITWEGENILKSTRPELGSAKRIVAGGRALKDKETFENLLTPLADALGAGIGATRAAVDNGFCDNSLQIGQTGKVVAPELYIAAGISGAIQHLAGIKDSKVIVAINNDPEAPILKIADYALVDDVFKVLPELTEKVK
ncbi:hypothetical protein RNJ44_03651 [Nakaseomyces bracarensis]|uniref:Probable electron transfer flavoprotein subunit alpha n=1 Tax=Nakaseomyces bracarensis TaxID=273131 RepID=A0ABR4NXL6_9SACH